MNYKVLFFVGSFLLFSGCTVVPTQDDFVESVVQEEIFQFSENEFDFGVIKQSGGLVSHDFSFVYHGDESLLVTGTPTSCACTSGEISDTDLQPGDEGMLTVTFDPNLHAEPEEKFFKTVVVLTEPTLSTIPEVKIWVDIDLDLGPGAYKLQAPHQD